MKMIGMSARSVAIRFWSSRPFKPGSETSNTRQLGTWARGWARKSSADANVLGCQPAVRISNSRDSRTEISSSTTKTIASLFSEGHIERLQKGPFAERLEQTLDGTMVDQALPDGLIGPRGDVDDRNLRSAASQLRLEVRPAHAGHCDIQNQALRLAELIRREERFRR